jgi:hypothetical protein
MKELQEKKKKEQIEGKKQEIMMMHGSYTQWRLVATPVVKR